MTASAGATDAASGPVSVHEGRRHRDRRAIKRSDWRGGRAGPSTLRIGAARLRAWRVAGVAICAARSARERNGAAQCASTGAVRQARERFRGRSVLLTALSECAIPGRGTGRPRHRAGAAGLTVLREGLKPVRVETNDGSMRSTKARPAQPGAPRTWWRDSWLVVNLGRGAAASEPAPGVPFGRPNS